MAIKKGYKKGVVLDWNAEAENDIYVSRNVF